MPPSPSVSTSAVHPHFSGRSPSGNAGVTVAPCCNNVNDLGQIVGFSLDSSFNQRALLWQTKDQSPVDLNTLVPADSPWQLLIPSGITDAGEIAATALNLNTSESSCRRAVSNPWQRTQGARRDKTTCPAEPPAQAHARCLAPLRLHVRMNARLHQARAG
jgi:probable HAF family extracellular repeat protein